MGHRLAWRGKESIISSKVLLERIKGGNFLKTNTHIHRKCKIKTSFQAYRLSHYRGGERQTGIFPLQLRSFRSWDTVYLCRCQQPQQEREVSTGGGEGTNMCSWGEQEKTERDSRVFPLKKAKLLDQAEWRQDYKTNIKDTGTQVRI